MPSQQPPFPTTLMLVLPLPVFKTGDRVLLDAQAINGLRCWLQNFDRIILCLTAVPADQAVENTIPFDPAMFGDRCELVTLPAAYWPMTFARTLSPTIRLLGSLIDQSTHLSFAISGLLGDWASVAAIIAHRKKRRASVWTDRVASAATFIEARRKHGLKRVYWAAQAAAMRLLERAIIRRTAIGLFHGADCYAAYSRYSPEPHLVHDIHLDASARIEQQELESKIASITQQAPLSIIYVGRTHPDKGVIDWISALRILADRGLEFSATWLGTGPEWEVARQIIARNGLQGRVDFPGNLAEREALMARLRRAHIFMFCHKTPESPRCLIEALLSGTPIVGYESAYARDLTAAHGGGVMTPPEPQALADAVLALANDRTALADLARRATADGYPFIDTEVFRHRSDLIKERD